MTQLKTLKVTAAVATAAFVAAGAVSASPRVEGPRTLTLVSVQKQFTTVPPISKASPPQIGGRLIFNDVLYNQGAQFGKPSGARVGTADNICTLVSNTALQCTLVAHVPNGALIVTGSIALNSKVTNLAVTGGVGAYAGAHGSATGRDVTQEKTMVVVHLTS
jgi:hypothetical protein